MEIGRSIQTQAGGLRRERIDTKFGHLGIGQQTLEKIINSNERMYFGLLFLEQLATTIVVV